MLLFTCLLLPNASRAELANFVNKYQNVTISQKDLLKLSKYEYLIEYFCDFSFFKPNHKVNPDFIKALILAESGGNPLAVSPKKALGLSQIILSTGKRAATEIINSRQPYQYIDMNKLINLKEEHLFDPATNILLTCYLISKYNFLYEGKLDLVLSAWNAGENTDSLKNGKPAPYSETHNLIGKVNGYYVYLLKIRNSPNKT